MVEAGVIFHAQIAPEPENTNRGIFIHIFLLMPK
jgi:hypothetical protein